MNWLNIIHRKPKKTTGQTRKECEHNYIFMLALIDCPLSSEGILGCVKVTTVYLYF